MIFSSVLSVPPLVFKILRQQEEKGQGAGSKGEIRDGSLYKPRPASSGQPIDVFRHRFSFLPLCLTLIRLQPITLKLWLTQLPLTFAVTAFELIFAMRLLTIPCLKSYLCSIIHATEP